VAAAAASSSLLDQMVSWLLTPLATLWTDPAWAARLVNEQAFVQVTCWCRLLAGAFAPLSKCKQTWEAWRAWAWKTKALGWGVTVINEKIESARGKATDNLLLCVPGVPAR
jgi:hypothetical protein